MQLTKFIDLHGPALESDQARHNLLLGVLAGASERPEDQLRLWTLGGPGQCAVEMPACPIVLGELEEAHCRRLAEDTAALDYPAVFSPDETAKWFVQRATELGITFQEPMAQRIHALSEPPTYPGVRGYPRQAVSGDAGLLADWLTNFAREAAPHDPLRPREQLEAKAIEGQHWFWIVDDEPVSLAGIVRRTREAAAIAPVYTPPHHRRRGFAGSITAAVVERIFAEGRKTACLYTNLEDPASNRCYANLGFKPVCDSWFYMRHTG